MTISLDSDLHLRTLLNDDFELFCNEKVNFKKLVPFLRTFIRGSAIEKHQILLDACRKQFRRADKSCSNAACLCILILDENSELLDQFILKDLEQALLTLSHRKKFQKFLAMLNEYFGENLIKKIDSLLEGSKSGFFHLLCLQKLKYSRKDNFNRLLTLTVSSDAEWLIKDSLQNISFLEVWDRQVVQKNLLRNPENIVPNLLQMIPALGDISDENCAEIASLLLPQLKSSSSVVSLCSAKLISTIFRPNDNFISLLKTVMNEKSIVSEAKLPIVKVASMSDEVFEMFQKAFSREINEDLKKAMLHKMSLMQGKETSLFSLITTLLNSSKVSDKRISIPALMEIVSRGTSVDPVPNLKSLLRSFFSSVETCSESIFVMKMLQCLDWSEPKLFNAQVEYLFKIFLNGNLKLDNEASCCLLETVPCAQTLIIALSGKFDHDSSFIDSSPFKTHFKVAVENAIRNCAIWDQLIDLKMDFNFVFKQNIIRFMHSTPFPEKSFLFFLKLGISFRKLKRFFYTRVNVESVIKEPHFALALEFLSSLHDPSIQELLLRESFSFSRDLFGKFINASVISFPSFVKNHLLQIYPRLVEDKLYFSIYLLLRSFHFESKNIFEQVQKSLFDVLIDNKPADLTTWIEEHLPRSISFFNLIFPILQSSRKLNDEELGKVLDFIAQYDFSIENCNFLALVELMFSHLKSCLLLHSRIEKILIAFIGKNNFNSHSVELQSALCSHYFSSSLLAKKYALLFSQQLTELTPESAYHIWALKYDDEYEISCLATEICSKDHFKLSHESFLKFEEYVFNSGFTFPEFIMRGYCALFSLFPETYGRNFVKFLSAYQEYSAKGIHNIRPREQLEKENVREIISKFLLETCELIGRFSFLSQLQDFFCNEVIDYERESDEIISNIVDTMCNVFKQTFNMNTIVEFYKKIDSYSRNTKGKIIALCGLIRIFPKSDILYEIYLKKSVDYASFPNDNVQNVVASYLSECWNSSFAALMRDSVLPKLTNGSSTWERRGAAYLVSTFVMKMGLEFVGHLQIEQLILKESLQHTKEGMEGCLFLIEMLSLYMQNAFEPYMIKFIPFLISCNGEDDEEIRNACSTCIPMVMKHVSQHGLCIILPIVLKHLEEPEWKIKSGSALLLGSMSQLAPQLLSRNLSTIISALGDALKVPHPRVQTDAKMALDSFVCQIATPEIKSLAPALLTTIANPSTVDRTLEAIMQTAFGHYLQENDLCLLIPVILIGLKKHQSSNTKKTSAQILGNMLKLVEGDKVQPYIGSLINSLLDAMTDCVAEVRSVTAKVIGFIFDTFHLFQSDAFDWLIPLLIEGMREGKAGNAQVLGEILGSCPTERFHSYLPVLLDGCKCLNLRSDTSRSAFQQIELSRSLFLNLFVYLASTLKESVYSSVKLTVFPVLLECLCDSSDKIREIALKASQLLLKVGSSATSSVGYDSQIIELLCRGVHDANYNIRIAALQLVHDFCSLASSSSDHKSYQDLLSLIYISRMDHNPAVKVQAMQVWKNLIQNSAKTLKDILPNLLSSLIKILNIYGGDLEFTGNVDKIVELSEGQVQMAIGTIQEICSKIEEIVLSRLLAIQTYSQGYATVLYFVIRSTNKSYWEQEYEKLFEVLSQLTNCGAFVPTLQLIKSTLSKQIESILIPKLISDIISESNVKIENCLEVKGFMPAILQVVLQGTVPIGEKFLTLIRAITGSAEIIPYAEDVFDFLLQAHYETEQLDVIEDIAINFVNSIEASYGMYDVLGQNYSKKSYQLNLYSTIFMLSFTASVISTIKIDTCEKMMLSLFRNEIIFTDERIKPFLERFLMKFPIEAWIFNMLFSALQFSPQFNPNCEVIVSFIMKNISTSSDEIQLVLLQILRLLSCNGQIKNLISLVGLLIRIFGEKRAVEVKAEVMACISALTNQSSATIKPFVPQLLRLIIRSLGQESDRGMLKNSIDLLTALGPQLGIRIENVINELSEQEHHSYIAICELIKSTGIKLQPAIIKELLQKSNKLNSPLITGTLTGICIGALNDCSDELVADILSEIESDCDACFYASCSIFSLLPENFNQLKYDWSLYQLKQATLESKSLSELSFLFGHLNRLQLCINFESLLLEHPERERILGTRIENCESSSSSSLPYLLHFSQGNSN